MAGPDEVQENKVGKIYRRKQDNVMFQCDQKGFFWTLEEDGAREGKMPEMDKFVDFCGGIWERKEQTPYMPWMEEI